MELTLHLEDALAKELVQQASAEQVPVVELAHRLMRDSLQRCGAESRWRAQNRRRLELIAKKQTTPLSAEEQEEWAQLQANAFEFAAPFDKALRQTVERLRQEVEGLP